MDLSGRCGLKNIFFRNKIFLVLQDRKLKLLIPVWNWISLNLTNFQLTQLIQTIVIFIFFYSCPIESKFCEVSQNYFSKSFWKFELEKQKSFIPKKKLGGRCQYQNKNVLFTDPIFGEGFACNNLLLWTDLPKPNL